jgi:hypothetical protein
MLVLQLPPVARRNLFVVDSGHAQRITLKHLLAFVSNAVTNTNVVDVSYSRVIAFDNAERHFLVFFVFLP